MAIKLFLKFFFKIPVWFLRLLTFQKSIVINNQILDHQTQAFLALQSLQIDTFDDPSVFNSPRELREKLIDGLPLSSKPCMPVQCIDHLLSTEFGSLQIRDPGCSGC